MYETVDQIEWGPLNQCDDDGNKPNTHGASLGSQQ